MALKGAEEAKAAVDAEIIAGRQAAHQVEKLMSFYFSSLYVDGKK